MIGAHDPYEPRGAVQLSGSCKEAYIPWQDRASLCLSHQKLLSLEKVELVGRVQGDLGMPWMLEFDKMRPSHGLNETLK